MVLLLIAPPAWAAKAPASEERGDQAVASACLQDLASLPDFLRENDAGIHDQQIAASPQAMAAADTAARAAAERVDTDDGCDRVLRQYLQNWRRAHLTVLPLGEGTPAAPDTPADRKQAAAASTPTVRALSNHTLLITVPTFDGAVADTVADLLRRERRLLVSRRSWIIDVRGNGGGSDHVWAPLLDWIAVNPVENIGVEFLATPANAEATAAACGLLAPGDQSCADLMDALAGELAWARPGTWITAPGDEGETWRPPADGRLRPRHVAILIDHGCGSSCEQFLLAARQSANVKLYGRATHGALDYSNLRPRPLPSGRRVLLYATSRSKRLPMLRVDPAGIQPDIPLLKVPGTDAARRAEIDTVRRQLEALSP